MKMPICEISVRVIESEAKTTRVITFRVGILSFSFEFDNHQMADLMCALWTTARSMSYYAPVCIASAQIPTKRLKGHGMWLDAETLGADMREMPE
jgi:hypothetical protein